MLLLYSAFAGQAKKACFYKGFQLFLNNINRSTEKYCLKGKFKAVRWRGGKGHEHEE